MKRAYVVSTLAMLAGISVATAAAEDVPANFHHVRLNVTNPEKTIEFYRRFLNAVPVKYRGVTDALFTEKSFILLNKVDLPPRNAPTTAIAHIGWGGKNGPTEFEWLKSQGVEFETPVTPLGNNYYMYFYGADRELIEIFTGSQNYLFNHVHLYATDVNEMAEWFSKYLGLPNRGPRPRPEDPERIWSNGTRADNVGIVIFEKPKPGGRLWTEGMKEEFEPTQGHAINHIAFSYRDIGPVFERMKRDGAEIVEPIAERPDMGHKSFFVLAPDKLLVEIVEQKPIPEGIWE